MQATLAPAATPKTRILKVAAGDGQSDIAALFQTLDVEHPASTLAVSGIVPEWLSGSLVRNGPAAFESGDARLRHWFDGSAMLHRFDIAGGSVSYCSRMLASRHHAAMADGRLAFRKFATDPCYGLFGRLMSVFRPNLSDNANINVARFGDDYVALAESALPIVFDPRTLATLGVYDIDGRDRLGLKMTTAHPIAAGQGWMLSHQTHLGPASRYEIVSLDPATRRQTTLVRIPVRNPSYMHSFAVSERRMVLTAFPFAVRPLDLLMGRRPFIKSHRWRPEQGTRFYVVDRSDHSVWVCRADAAFAFHHVNAFDDGNDLLVDIIAYDDPNLIDHLYLDRLRDACPSELPRGRMRRYRLPAGGGEARLDWIRPEAIELPCIDSRMACRRHNVVWGVGTPDDSSIRFPHAICRMGLGDGSVRWWSQPHCFAGEPVFVARPDAGEKDDGLLLSLVLDAARGHSFLLLLDATTLQEVARADAPVAVPAGLHGRFFSERSAADMVGT